MTWWESSLSGSLPFCLAAFCCSVFGSLNLTTVRLSGVGGSFQKHADAESKGIKAHFNMDESGVLLLDRVSSCHHLNCCTFLLQSSVNHGHIRGPNKSRYMSCFLYFHPQVEAVFETVEEEKEEESTLTSRFCRHVRISFCPEYITVFRKYSRFKI